MKFNLVCILKEGDGLNQKEQVLNYLSEILQEEDREHLIVLYMDTKKYVIAYQVASIGSRAGSLVDVSIIFKGAILSNCKGIILIHNHLSSSAETSKDDLNVTNKIIQGGRILDIPLLDHIIISSKKMYSFKENGLI